MKFSKGIDDKLEIILQKYKLTNSSGGRLVKSIREFIKNNKETMQVLQSFIDFVDSATFALDEPVKDEKGKTYLVKTLHQGERDGALKWIDVTLMDAQGKESRVSIDKVSKYNKKTA